MFTCLLVPVVYLECAVVSLQLSAEALQLAAGQDGLAVLVPQVVLLLHQLALLLLQGSHLLLGVTLLLQLSDTHKHAQHVCIVYKISHIGYLPAELDIGWKVMGRFIDLYGEIGLSVGLHK